MGAFDALAWLCSIPPQGSDLQSDCRNYRLCLGIELEPPLRIKLRSARYRRAALSLCYGGGGALAVRTPCPEGTVGLATPDRNLSAYTLQNGGRRLVPTRKPVRVPTRFERVPRAAWDRLPWRRARCADHDAPKGTHRFQGGSESRLGSLSIVSWRTVEGTSLTPRKVPSAFQAAPVT